MKSIHVAALMAALGGLLTPERALADAVTDWNVATFAAVEASGVGKTFLGGTRTVAMTHAAVHDALNAIHRRYRPWAYDGLGPTSASPEAAVAAAAYGVLVSELPTQKPALDAAYGTALAAIADGSARSDGIAIGQAAAAAVLAKKANDGSATPMPYTSGTAPGEWQPTPPAFAQPLAPEWAYG